MLFQPGAVQAVDHVSLVVGQGEFVTIVGPSGCGKTTLLRMMAGLLRPTEGAVSLSGRALAGPGRGAVLVFQDFSRSLLPWRRALGNVKLGLEARGTRPEGGCRIAQSYLQRVGLSGQEERFPWELSGGMQQRLALARALACQPSVLLLDEPFGSLDARTREELEDEMLSLGRQLDLTIVLVTHDIDEAIYLGDRVVLLTERPARIRLECATFLGSHRDQVSTRSSPEFLKMRQELRQHLWSE